MAQRKPEDRLQPALLDRLTDNDPQQKVESRDRRIISMQRLKEYVRRDLDWLLNTGSMASQVDFTGSPEVEKSVLNYGVPDITGMHVAGAPLSEIQDALRRAILQFEPRLLARSLRVSVETDGDDNRSHALRFSIAGELWSQPAPQEIYWLSEIDLESGDVMIREGER